MGKSKGFRLKFNFNTQKEQLKVNSSMSELNFRIYTDLGLNLTFKFKQNWSIQI